MMAVLMVMGLKAALGVGYSTLPLSSMSSNPSHILPVT